MKYICYKKILSKIADQEIKDPQDIKAILEVIKAQELSCSIRIHDENGGSVSFKEIRINSISEDSFSYTVLTQTSRLQKSSKFEDLDFLELTCVDAIMAFLKPGTDRWNLIDPDDGT